MQAHNYHYGRPEDAVNELAGLYEKLGPTPSLQKREIATATDDALCAQQAQLIPTLLDAVREYLLGTAPEELGALSSLADFRSAATHRAQEVMHQ